MLLGFNMLLWTTNVTEEHFPIFDTLKKVGYDGIELPIFEGTPEQFARIGDAARNSGLRITGVSVIPDEDHDCLSGDKSIQQAGLDHIHWAVDCLAACGGELLCGPFHQPLGVFTGAPPREDEYTNLVSVHQRAAKYALEQNVKLAIEPLNRFECYVLNTVEDAAAIVKRVNTPGYGLLYDTFHANIEEKDPVGVIAPHLDQINHVHFSENDRGTPGKGHVPWQATLTALKRSGYDGWCTIEAFGRALPELAAATRVWRDFFPAREEVYQFGHDFLRETWEKA